jgi:Ion transport protein
MILSFVDIALSATLIWGKDASEINRYLPVCSLIRFIRVIRVLKLARYWIRFELILETLAQTAIDVRWFSILLAIFLYIYTILGMDYFSHQAKFNAQNQLDHELGVSPMFHFDDFINSLFTVYVILTNDGQSIIYYNFYRAVGAAKSTVYWVAMVIFGQKIIVNLFLAFLLENFDENAMNERILKIQEDDNQIGRMDSKINIWVRITKWVSQ